MILFIFSLFNETPSLCFPFTFKLLRIISSIFKKKCLIPMQSTRINKKLSYTGTFKSFFYFNNIDLFPVYVQEANEIGFSGEVFCDEIPAGRKAIGTHSGCFHSDDALACSMLRSLPEYQNHGITLLNVFLIIVIVRSRNMDILNQCDIVVDVGGLYDPEKSCYFSILII